MLAIDWGQKNTTIISVIILYAVRILLQLKKKSLTKIQTAANTASLFQCLALSWSHNTFFWLFDCLGLFTSDVALFVLSVLKDSQRFSSAWRYASLRRLILQTKLNGFPLEGLWLIPDAYSILCGHCSRKFPPDRTKRTRKPNTFIWDSVQGGLWLIHFAYLVQQLSQQTSFVIVKAFRQWRLKHEWCFTKKPCTRKCKRKQDRLLTSYRKVSNKDQLDNLNGN